MTLTTKCTLVTPLRFISFLDKSTSNIPKDHKILINVTEYDTSSSLYTVASLYRMQADAKKLSESVMIYRILHSSSGSQMDNGSSDLP